MAVTVYTKDDVTILLGEQATFGTALGDTDDFNGTTPEFGEILDCEIASLDTDVRIREPNRSNAGGRILLAANVQHDEKGASPKFTFSGDAKERTLAAAMYSVVQNVAEAVGSPFEKTYTFAATQPDFTANAGWFGTLIVKQPIASSSQKVRDMIGRKLTLTCEPETNQGRMQMNWELIGRGAATTTSNPSTGLLTASSQSFFYFNDLKTITLGGTVIYPLSIKMEYMNNPVAISHKVATDGDFLTYALTKYEVKYTIRILWDSASFPIKNFENDTPTGVPLILTWGADDAQGYFTQTTYVKVDPSPDTYDPVKGVELNMTMVDDGTNEPFTCVIADALDRAW